MPVLCELDLRRIATHEMRTLDYAVMNYIYETHNVVGCLADEGIYQKVLARILRASGIRASTEVPVDLVSQFQSSLPPGSGGGRKDCLRVQS